MKWDVEIQFSLAQKGIELWLVHVIPWNNSDSISLVMQHILKCSCLVNIGEAFHVDGSVAMWQLVLNKILLSNRLTAYPGTLKMTVLKKEQGQFFEENCWKHFLHHLFFFFFFAFFHVLVEARLKKLPNLFAAQSLSCSITNRSLFSLSGNIGPEETPWLFLDSFLCSEESGLGSSLSTTLQNTHYQI